MGKAFRIILGTLALGITVGAGAAMFSEPFWSELFRRLGVDSSAWVGPMLTLFAQEWFQLLCAGVVGAAIGAWGHWGATRIDRRSPDRAIEDVLLEQGERDIEFELFVLKNEFEQIFDRYFSNETVVIDGKFFRNCRFENVTLEYNGIKPFGFESNIFVGTFTVATKNRYADRFSGFLAGFDLLGVQARDNGVPLTPGVTRVEGAPPPWNPGPR